MIFKCIFLLNVLILSAKCEALRTFPDEFKFGIASSSYQVEGGWNADGKSESIWDRMVHTSPDSIADNSTGDISCNSYNLWQRDVEMIRELGVDFYRFSISWPRILSDAPNVKINQAGVDYYNNLINELLKYNIEPVVTIFHWDMPQTIQDLGGWANREIVKYLTNFADVAYSLFGDRVKTWITINQPKQICVDGYTEGVKAPQVISPGTGVYLCVKNTLLAHASMWHLYDQKYRTKQGGICGYTLHTQWYEGATNSTEDKQAAEDATSFEQYLYLDPVYSESGDYPEIVKQRIYNKSMEQGFSYSRLPELSAEEIKYIRGTYDYIGINNYGNYVVKRASTNNITNVSPSYLDDMDAEISAWTDDMPITDTEALYLMYKDFYNRCGDKPFYIFENGFNDKRGFNDSNRIDFFKGSWTSILNAIDDGVNIARYTSWALMDNFEWSWGYTRSFGLYEVDFEDDNRPRTARASAFVLKNAAKYHTLDYDFTPSADDTMNI